MKIKDFPYHILSFSGGKESTALGIELIERGYPLNEAVFFDSGWEFDEVYANVDKMQKFFEANGVKFTRIKAPLQFDYLFQKNSWCGGNCRWGTTYKIRAIDNYAENLNACVYIGLAYDEKNRIDRNKQNYKFFPLYEMRHTMEDCLQICYENGYDFGGLYKYLSHLSCKYCYNHSIDELRSIYHNLPDLWQDLKVKQSLTDFPYKNYPMGIFGLEVRFCLEDDYIRLGKDIKSKDFFDELDTLLINHKINKIRYKTIQMTFQDVNKNLIGYVDNYIVFPDDTHIKLKAEIDNKIGINSRLRQEGYLIGKIDNSRG